MTQLTLPLAATADPPTSHQAAAELVRSGRHDAQKQLVLAALKKFPGRTSAELAQLMFADRHMVARRLADLKNAGQARQCAARTCRAKGTQAMTWEAIEKGGN